MNRKEFLKIISFGTPLLALGSWKVSDAFAERGQDRKNKNWLWLHPWRDLSDDEYKKRFDEIKSAGIDAVLPNLLNGWEASYKSRHLHVGDALLEKLLPIAKSAGLEVHAWMWSMICNQKKILENHPDWFAVNRNGQNTIEKPAYVNYYRFMCPNHPAVQEFVSTTVSELSEYSELDGIHLDYIRYPDVILAEKFQKKYGIVQDKEYPEYDYCYCDICCSKFKSETGIDIKKADDPGSNNAWNQFRYDSITSLVNTRLVPVAKKSDKYISAAVFPNWMHVRQQWSKWDVDAVFPMLYHGYYSRDIDWVENNIIAGKNSIHSKTKLYSGLFTGFFSPEELNKAIERSINAGADGVSLFAYHTMKETHWDKLPEVLVKHKD